MLLDFFSEPAVICSLNAFTVHVYELYKLISILCTVVVRYFVMASMAGKCTYTNTYSFDIHLGSIV